MSGQFAQHHDHFNSALLALDVHGTVLEPATAQVGAEFAGDEGGEPFAAALVGSAGQEGISAERSSSSSRFSALPVAVTGAATRNSTMRSTLYTVSRSRQ